MGLIDPYPNQVLGTTILPYWTGTTNATNAQITIMPSAYAEDRPETPLEWLRRRVAEVCVLAGSVA